MSTTDRTLFIIGLSAGHIIAHTEKRALSQLDFDGARLMLCPCVQDTPGLRALGSKWARLLDNLPDVSQLLDASDVSAARLMG
jgi:hypothetical protein